jgi:putative DNA primase/helicase
MALKPLTPPCKQPLHGTFAVVVPEAGRGTRGVVSTIDLFDGDDLIDSVTDMLLSDRATRRMLAVDFAPKAGGDVQEITKALLTLSRGVEGMVRQIEVDDKAARAAAKAAKAQEHGPVHLPTPPPGEDPAASLDAVGPHTQGANAQRIHRDFADKLIYTTGAGWLMWTGSHWRIDPSKDDALTTGFVATLPKIIAKEAQELMSIALGCPPGQGQKELFALANDRLRWALQSDNASAIAGALKMAKHGLRKAYHEFDADPWLFNVRNGTLDLRTGALRPHASTDLLTRCAPVVFCPEATCPKWEVFLLQVFKNDQAMVDFMQRIIGWSLTGIVQERALFFLYGPTGWNGKTTVVETIKELLGSCGEEDDEVGYARKVDVNTFMVGKNVEENQRKMASLIGPRFVFTTEVDASHRLNERLIKDITGGDTVEARRLYHEPFSFKPTFKAWMYGNYRPDIRDTDDAIWGRVKLIEFNVCFKESMDLTLGETLKSELAGILNWAIRGCLSWQKMGMCVPEKVQKSTQDYRQEQDIFAPFIAGRCVVGEGKSEKFAALWGAYKRWCARKEEEEGKQVRFTNYLNAKGYLSDNNATGRGARRLGIALNPDYDPTEDDPDDLFSQASATPATPAAQRGSSAKSNNDKEIHYSNTSSATPTTPKMEKSRGKESLRNFPENGVAGVAARGVDEPHTRMDTSDTPATPSVPRGSSGVAPQYACPHCGQPKLQAFKGDILVCHSCGKQSLKATEVTG